MLKSTLLLVSFCLLILCQNDLIGNALLSIELKTENRVPEGGIKIGAGWDFLHVFSGGKGILYAITDNYDLLYYKHQDNPTGERQFTVAGLKIGTGWEFKHVFSGGDGVIYAINQKNELIYYKHYENPTTSKNFIEPGIRIGTGWDFKKVFAGGGIIYAINHNDDLIYYKHIANPTKDINFENPGYKIGAGWNFRDVFSGGNNIIFAVNDKDELLFYQHENNPNQEKQFIWTGETFEFGWNFTNSMSGGYGIIYGMTKSNDLFYYDNMTIKAVMSKSFDYEKPTSKIEEKVNTPTIANIPTIKIGNQLWMTENLNTDRFRNGDIIPEAKTQREWHLANSKKQPAWCNFEPNKIKLKGTYGKLYNWYAVNDIRGLAPQGFHIPTEKECKELIKLNSGSFSGNALKDKFGWGIYSGNNSSGFSAMPSGFRSSNGEFGGAIQYWLSRNGFIVNDGSEYIASVSCWWLKEDAFSAGYGYSALNSGDALNFVVGERGESIEINVQSKGSGYSVRCIKD